MSRRNKKSDDLTTSLSLAGALAIGCLARLDPDLKSVNVWDPTAGTGLAGSVLAGALQAAGVDVRYRGQDISETAVTESRHRFEDFDDAELVAGDTLVQDQFPGFRADLAIVDPPWGARWGFSRSEVERRRDAGEFGFGLPQDTDSTWLFISLALEKLRDPSEGGGRVAALANPRVLSAGGGSAAVRRSIVEAGLLESVTRLPEGLAPNTGIPLYLLTFTNTADPGRRGKAMIADLQTQFTTVHRRRSLPVTALQELESGLRSGKSGPRNRTVNLRQFIRRDARVSRVTGSGNRFAWGLTTYNDTEIDEEFLDSRYGADSGVALDEEPREVIDLGPSYIFDSGPRELLRDLANKGWTACRLSGLLLEAPEAVKGFIGSAGEDQLFIARGSGGGALTELPDADAGGRHLSIHVDGGLVEPGFLSAWLNSEQGLLSRQRAASAAGSGMAAGLVPKDARSLMRWADELIVPVPDSETQRALTSADEKFTSFRAELESQRASIWTAPETAGELVNKIARAFDDSLDSWLDDLPFPIASALWTAHTASSLGGQQQAYLRAWEAMATFHATVLLSASRNDPGSSSDTEAAIRGILHEHGLDIERASFGTWVIIVEKTAKDLRRALESGDADEEARVRRAFADLPRTGIERLISKDVVNKFKEVARKRNRWLGHTGYTPEQALRRQIESLVTDLRELCQLLGNVWEQLFLVRAGSAKRKPDGMVQSAEVAMGGRSPFLTKSFTVGDIMNDGELYLVREQGSQSPLQLGHFVQLLSASPDAQYTSYFYNSTDGDKVRLVSYQYGPQNEVQDDAARFRAEFGALALRSP